MDQLVSELAKSCKELGFRDESTVRQYLGSFPTDIVNGVLKNLAGSKNIRCEGCGE